MFTLCNLIKTILPMHFQPETLIPAETLRRERGFSYSMPAHIRSSARHLCSSAAAFIVVLGLVTSAVASPACAERPQDEIWLVSARQVGCLGSGDVPHLPTQRYDDQSGWKEADVAEIFQPSTPDQMLVIFIHGNRVESTQAACEGRYVYRLITSRIEDPVSIRFVIWSWPSARNPRPAARCARQSRTHRNRGILSGLVLGPASRRTACQSARLQLWGAHRDRGVAPARRRSAFRSRTARPLTVEPFT